MGCTNWFGENWGAPVCTEEDHVDTPIGKSCVFCGETIIEGDQGVVNSNLTWHIECHLRQVIGGLNHIRRTCHCYGGTDDPDPPNVSLRKAARLAVVEWEALRR